MPDALSLNLNHLRYFHVVAEEGSLAAASRRLGVGQSTLSEQIKQLELSLGERLFDRGGGPLRLNDAGRTAFEQTSHVLRAAEMLTRRFASEESPRRELLSIGVSSPISRSFAADYLVPVFEMEDVRVRVLQGDYEYLLHRLVAHEIDLFLSSNRPSAPDSSGIQVRVVLEPQLVAVASPKLAERLDGFPGCLDGAPLITFSPHSKYRFDIDQMLHDRVLRPDVVGEVDDVGIQLAVALKGCAVTILPWPVVEGHVERGALVELGETQAIESKVYALFHAEQPSRHVLAAIDVLTGGTTRDDG